MIEGFPLARHRINEGDIVTLRWTATKNWGDGKVTLSHKLSPTKITISEDAISDVDIDPGGKAAEEAGHELRANLLDAKRNRKRPPKE